MLTLINKKETEKELAHIDVIVKGKVIGYIMKNHSPNVNTQNAFVFTSKVEHLPTFYYRSKKGLIGLIEEILKGNTTTVLCGFGIEKTITLS